MILEQIDKDLLKMAEESDVVLKDIYKKIDDVCLYNSDRILAAFIENHVSYSDFADINGYGNYDEGRDKIERIFATVLGCEDALVRPQIMSGTNALYLTLSALLKHGDTMISISGAPYDSLQEMIGLCGDSTQSLKANGVKYEQIDLVNDDFDYKKIEEYLKNNKVKVIEIQRSKGYSTRKSIGIDKVEKVIKLIKSIDENIIVMVDNCYCEFVSEKEPTAVGADIMVGSLIKNLGGGIAPNGAYIAGRHDLVELAGERLTLPGEGREVGPSLGINRKILQGIYMAPSVVASALKTATLASRVLEKLGYDVEPKYTDDRADIVQNIIFRDKDKLIEFTRGIQEGSAIDANAVVEPVETPGYIDKIVMASGSFTQGSSIELSCDGPVRAPYIAYMQGALTYPYGKLGLMKAVERIKSE